MKRKKLTTLFLAASVSLAAVMQSYAFYKLPSNKKGILMSDINMVDDVVALGCSQVILNFNASRINEDMISFDRIINKMHQSGLTITLVVYNDFQPGNPMVPDGAQNSTNGQYSFNTLTDTGRQSLQSFAANLASRYRDKVSNWIIGNEVNNEADWMTFPNHDFESYIQNYADSFRVFYDTIHAANPEARVFVPFDFYWNHSVKEGWFPARDTLNALNARLSDLDYGIAWHPYPQDFTNADFTKDNLATESRDSIIVNMKNLHILTDYLQQQPFLSPAGTVRHVLLSEEGFSSFYGEDIQAAAITYALQIANENPYVEGLLINRLEDNPGLVSMNYNFGLWYTEGSENNPVLRKPAWEAYRNAQ